jgi:hypothetical protein
MMIEIKLGNLSFGDSVCIDRGDVWGIVTAMSARPSCGGEPVPQDTGVYVTFEISYVLNGEAKVAWIESWRLSK